MGVDSLATPDAADAGAGAGCLSPAAACRHITFAVAAEYALASSNEMRRLLEAVPGSSLTVYTGMGSLGVSPSAVHDLITTYGKQRCFLDLRVVKPFRSCTPGACCVQ